MSEAAAVEKAPAPSSTEHGEREQKGQQQSSLPALLLLQGRVGNRAVAQRMAGMPTIQRAPAKTVPVLPPKQAAPPTPKHKPAPKPGTIAVPPKKQPAKAGPLPPVPKLPDVPGTPENSGPLAAPTAAAPATGTDWIDMVNNSTLLKVVGEAARAYPGPGLIVGGALDVVGAVGDQRTAAAAGLDQDAKIAVGVRDGLSTVDGIVGHLQYVLQLCNAVGVVIPPALAVITPANETITGVKTGLDAAVLVMDVVEAIEVRASIGAIGPGSSAAAKSLASGIIGNAVQDGASLAFDAIDAATGGLDESQAVKKAAKISGLSIKAVSQFAGAARGVLSAWAGVLANKGTGAALSPAPGPAGPAPAAPAPAVPAAAPAPSIPAQRLTAADVEGEGVMALHAAISGELGVMETAYGLGGGLLQLGIQNYHDTLQLIDKAMTLANGGKNPAARIGEISLQMQKEFDTRSKSLQETIGGAGNAKDKLAAVDSFAADLDAHAAKLVLPSIPPAVAGKDEGVLEAAERAVENQAIAVANQGLAEAQLAVNVVRTSLTSLAALIRTERVKIANFLQQVQDEAKKEMADIQVHVDNLAARMGKVKTFEGFAELLLAEATEAVGISGGLKPEDAKAAYDELAPLFPQVRGLLDQLTARAAGPGPASAEGPS